MTTTAERLVGTTLVPVEVKDIKRGDIYRLVVDGQAQGLHRAHRDAEPIEDGNTVKIYGKEFTL